MTHTNKPKLTLNIAAKPSADGNALSDAVGRKVKATETLADAWVRILAMKNSETDAVKLREVKRAMFSGDIGRDVSSAGKRFSKAEALRLHTIIAASQREEKLAVLVASTPDNYVLVTDETTLAQVKQAIEQAELLAFDCETFGKDNGALDPWRGNVAGFSVSDGAMNYYVPLNHTERTELTEARIIDELRKPLENAKTVMHNAPFDCKWFHVKYGIDLIVNLHADTRIMAMALDENRDHRLKNLLTDWLKIPSDNFDELFPKIQFNEVPLNVALPYAAGDTEKTLKLYEWMMTKLTEMKLPELERLLFEIEMPVCRQFIYSDLRGIRFDTERAHKLDAQLAIEEAELERKIYEIIGQEINLNSPAQISRLFFDEMKLTDHGKGSTNSRFIKKIEKEHVVVPLYSEYKGIGKLRQAFTQKLPNNVKQDGKIHPWHNTLGAATGRFTCKDPNTQQIPAKRPEVRHLFKATADDRILVSIDYSQIELRVLAHVANETVLIKAFEQGRDIHSVTAALISAGKFTYEEIEAGKDVGGSEESKYRKQAKTVNFGIVYGMGANKLADTLEITQRQAQKIIDDYFLGYPGIKRYMDEQHAKAKKYGYVTDIFGRKRRLHKDIRSKERWKVLSAERMAGNFPIQSGAGSILKKAVVDLKDVMPKLDVYILGQTHDELLFDCPRSIEIEDLHGIRKVMADAVKLVCPVNCDIEIYPERWQEKLSEEEFFHGVTAVSRESFDSDEKYNARVAFVAANWQKTEE